MDFINRDSLALFFILLGGAIFCLVISDNAKMLKFSKFGGFLVSGLLMILGMIIR